MQAATVSPMRPACIVVSGVRLYRDRWIQTVSHLLLHCCMEKTACSVDYKLPMMPRGVNAMHVSERDVRTKTVFISNHLNCDT